MLLARRSIDFLWLFLMGITVATAFVAESANPGFLAIVAIAGAVALKGRLVVDRFMELHNANRYIRVLMNAYFYFFPLMIVLVEIDPEALARWTSIL